MRSLAPLVLALLLLTSCGSVTGPGGDGGADLEGRTFLSTGVTEDGAARELVEGSRVRLSFEDGQVSAQAGCNSMFGTYHVRGGTLEVENLGMTEMGCPDGLAEQDQWLADLLTGGPALSLDGDELTLTSGTTTVTLLDRVVADPDRALIGPVWRVDSLISGEAVSSTPGGAEASLTFREDGTVEIMGGCNQGSAAYRVGDGTLTVEDPVMTAMGCEDARGTLERAVLDVLGAGELQWEITADRLTLSAGETGLGLRADG